MRYFYIYLSFSTYCAVVIRDYVHLLFSFDIQRAEIEQLAAAYAELQVVV